MLGDWMAAPMIGAKGALTSCRICRLTRPEELIRGVMVSRTPVSRFWMVLVNRLVPAAWAPAPRARGRWVGVGVVGGGAVVTRQGPTPPGRGAPAAPPLFLWAPHHPLPGNNVQIP